MSYWVEYPRKVLARGHVLNNEEVRLMTDEIERLEAENKALRGGLQDICEGEPEWPDDDARELTWCRNRARAALAQIKGGEDG